MSQRAYAIVALIFAVTALLFALNASQPLAEPDEARYAEVAREMVETGNWITPQINYQPFLDKPPLLFWATAACFDLFGTNAAVARLPVMLFAAAGLLATFLLAQAMYGTTTAVLATAILTTSPLYFGMGQLLTMDIVLTTLTVIAQLCAWRGFRTGYRYWYRLAYGATGFAMLAKGPVALVLVAVPLAVVCLRYKRPDAIRNALDLPGIILMIVIAAPWFVAADVANPGFLWTFLFRHHVERFVNPWQHRQPFWFYAYVLPVALFPWSVLWLLDARRQRGQPSRTSVAEATYLLACAASTIILFSVSRSKLVPYVLPALPPLAILLARAYERRLEHAPGRLARRAPLAVFVAGAVLAPVAAAFSQVQSNPRLLLLAPLLAVGSLLLLCEAGLLRYLRPKPVLGFATVVAAMFGILAVVEQGRGIHRSYAGLGAAAAALARPNDELVMYGTYVYGVGFYAHRQARVLGREQTQELMDLWSSPRRVLMVADRNDLAELAAVTGATPTLLAGEAGKVLITNEDARIARASNK